jgi:hypothetical protein
VAFEGYVKESQFLFLQPFIFWCWEEHNLLKGLQIS